MCLYVFVLFIGFCFVVFVCLGVLFLLFVFFNGFLRIWLAIFVWFAVLT